MPSASALRASLLHPVEAPPQPGAEYPRPVPENAVPPPSADELLEASASLQRLCASYHRTHRLLVTRSRRQRLGLALLVSSVAVGALVLNRSGSLTPETLSNMILAVAGASCVALVILALLWTRDDQRLRCNQGDRLLRALQFSCELPADRIEAFHRFAEPIAAFFDCYAVWRTRHPDQLTGLAALVDGFTKTRRRAAA
jgi:hypothetical protein